MFKRVKCRLQNNMFNIVIPLSETFLISLVDYCTRLPGTWHATHVALTTPKKALLTYSLCPQILSTLHKCSARVDHCQCFFFFFLVGGMKEFIESPLLPPHFHVKHH